MSRLELAINRIKASRRYIHDLIGNIETDDWFHMPEGCPTHIAWQIGHLTVSQYGLCLVRLRDMQPSDTDLLPRDMRRKFGKGTTPDADPEANPSIEALLRAFQAVHQQFLTEIIDYDEEALAEPLDVPHPLFTSKLGAIEFCPLHDMLHAGQIGLIRRMLGKSPLR